MNQIAAHYGVNIEKSKENHAEQKKLQEQLDYLNRQKRILQQSIDTSSKKQEQLEMVLELKGRGYNNRAIAEDLGIGAATVSRWLQNLKS